MLVNQACFVNKVICLQSQSKSENHQTKNHGKIAELYASLTLLASTRQLPIHTVE